MNTKKDLTLSLLELIRKASTELPADVIRALESAKEREEPKSASKMAIEVILKNLSLSREHSTPICQDTGSPLFDVYYPAGYPMRALEKQICEALKTATEKSYMRPNAVDSLTGKNSGNNLGEHFPPIYCKEWDNEDLVIRLLLKGGGSENMSCQYSLPDDEIGADRDIAGVKKAILAGIHQAQGMGCAPGVIGVCIGGDRSTGYLEAKRQLFRPLDDVHPDEKLRALEEELFSKANKLGIGPMGFGGKTTILGIKITTAHRLPASYFVSIAYLCWAARRATLTLKPDGAIKIE